MHDGLGLPCDRTRGDVPNRTGCGEWYEGGGAKLYEVYILGPRARLDIVVKLLTVSCQPGGRMKFVDPSANLTKYQLSETRERVTDWGH
jgi:hypothetical protein